MAVKVQANTGRVYEVMAGLWQLVPVAFMYLFLGAPARAVNHVLFGRVIGPSRSLPNADVPSQLRLSLRQA